MKKLLVIAATLACAVALNATAQDSAKPAEAAGKKKTALTADQKKLQKEMVEKYDANKDGKLDKEEKAKISADDKKKMSDAGLGPKKKEKTK
jgi:curli biogenesis system outer membrane secretion channel CsgG